jgi:hypothetical protein
MPASVGMSFLSNICGSMEKGKEWRKQIVDNGYRLVEQSRGSNRTKIDFALFE